MLYLSGSLWLFAHYRQPAFDVGLDEQTSWFLANGESFESVAGIHVFGAHFSPGLILRAPLALILGGPIPELAFQAMCGGGGRDTCVCARPPPRSCRCLHSRVFAPLRSRGQNLCRVERMEPGDARSHGARRDGGDAGGDQVGLDRGAGATPVPRRHGSVGAHRAGNWWPRRWL